ncbi:hypothetical protein ASZ90_000685 [hydrocarbon metagenome]|uniref:Uncharacterized protein n=1 Tax=hydrocarbon metagenome TaxID=938273 RepID=A0A0W8G8C5_9ZZZZ
MYHRRLLVVSEKKASPDNVRNKDGCPHRPRLPGQACPAWTSGRKQPKRESAAHKTLLRRAWQDVPLFTGLGTEKQPRRNFLPSPLRLCR